MKYFSFNYATDSFTSDIINAQFRELFTEASILVEDFIDANNETFDELTETTSLYYDLLFILITSISSTELQTPLHVYVDFSRSPAYSNHIKNNIQSFNSLNITFDTIISNDTDLFISDFADYRIKIPQIIWRDPPTVNDWSILGDTMIDIKKGKDTK